MNQSCIKLIDLPDELLMLIFKKINNLEVLYSFFDINDRLNLVLRDPVLANYLNFIKWTSGKFLNIYSSDIIFQRFCSQILPSIHDKIQRLGVDLTSAKQILYAADYPNLHELSLFNIEEDGIRHLFIDETLSCNLFQNQISKLVLSIIPLPNVKQYSTMKYLVNHIFLVFKKLTHLIFTESSYPNIVDLRCELPINFCSSILLVLKLKISSFNLCLLIVDGRFSQLHTLIVDLPDISPCIAMLSNKDDILTLKYFSMSCYWPTHYYDQLILPLLRRMSNLERLNLSISIQNILIDGLKLKNDIVNHFLRLNQFTFDIHSMMQINNETIFPTKEAIQKTFEDFQDRQVISYLDYLPYFKEYQCHMYTYPSQMSFYPNVSNQFPSGYYPYVRFISLYDEYPFEHEFFLRISRSFPCVEQLRLCNRALQQHKQSFKLTNLPIVEFVHLIELDIVHVINDYIVQFLSDTKTSFRNNICLRIDGNGLQYVSNNFTRQDFRINCSKVDKLIPYCAGKTWEYFQEYFPSSKDYFQIPSFDGI